MITNSIFTNIPIIELAFVIVCLVMSAFFSSSETALTSITREKALQLLEEQKSSRKYIRYWIENPNKILTLILIGNNVANIVATALVTTLAQNFFQNRTITAAVAIMTFLILVFGEIVPKTLARAIAPSLAIFSLRILIVFYYLFYPITFSFVKLAGLLGSLVGVKSAKHHSVLSQKDLDFLIDLADKEGALIGSRGEYLKAVSDFDELKVRNIMIPKNQTTAIESSISIPALMQIIEKNIHTRYPVYKDNYENFIGMLHVKDLLLQKEKCEAENSILSILRPVLWTNEYMKINDVLQMMKANKSQLMLIKDEYNAYSGIITMEDVLEELVGEIADEHDDDNVELEATKSDIIEVKGETPIHDLNEKFETEIDEDKDFQTINGFLLHLFNGVLPPKGTIVLWKNFEIKILSTKNNSIENIQIKRTNNNNNTDKSDD